MRIGIGYDIHKLAKDRDLILAGVKIPYELGLLGHSDADVVTHAIIDSILGALACHDIGYHFPDTDEKYKNANSIFLLQEVNKFLSLKKYEIINIDSNIICQKPKLLPYIDLMRKNIADSLNIQSDCVSIKAKTNEGMDSAGECLSISAQAVVLIDKIKM